MKFSKQKFKALHLESNSSDTCKHRGLVSWKATLLSAGEYQDEHELARLQQKNPKPTVSWATLRGVLYPVPVQLHMAYFDEILPVSI